MSARSLGISAVKAIGLAAAQGQKVYTITQEVFANNPNIVSANLAAHSYSTQQAVQNALYAGNEVTIHERPITQSGWTGSGYIYTDPQTGAGGYLIDGGSNGDYRKDNEAGTSITFTTLNPNGAEATLFVMSNLVASARVSIAARQALANTIRGVLPAVAEALASGVRLIASLQIFIVFEQMIAAASSQTEDIRDQVANSAAANSLTKDWPFDNCTLNGITIDPARVPAGWKFHTYGCRLAGQPISRFSR